ncbi:ABC transporter permease [uncultured Jatrophihabitans sp.]|uniref:ABC transporter permease n=1 Tax=uncultured Jatrophihabitans sp. TaxID=1610747 RepID=UPI0035CC606E
MTASIDVGAGADPVIAAENLEPGSGKRIEGRSPLALAFARLRRDRGAMISLGVIVLIIIVAIAAPLFSAITGHGPNDQYYGPDARSDVGLPAGPNSNFWLGADQAGRDVLVRIAFGARTALVIGIGATLMSVIVGVVLGLLAGYLGGIVDSIISRIIDTVLAIPYLLFGIALVSVVGSIGVFLIMVVIAVFGWASVARIIRGQVISIRERDFVEAARSLGAGDMRIMFVDVLPNVIAPAIVFSTLLIPVSVVTEAALSFLGVGIQPPTSDWGEMISDASDNQLYLQAWWFLFFPGMALLITTLAFNILGDGVRDAFDPRTDRLIPARKKKKQKREREPGDKMSGDSRAAETEQELAQ